MPQRRENPERILTPAEKQRRHRQKQQEDAERLRGLLYRLERAVWQASDAGDALAAEVRGGSAEAILEALVTHFETIVNEEL